MAITLFPSPAPVSNGVASPPVAVCKALKLEASVIVTVLPTTAPVFISSASSAVFRLTAVVPLLVPSFGVIEAVIAVTVPVNAAKIVFVGFAAEALTTVLNVFPFLVLPLAADVNVMSRLSSE